MNLRSTFLVAAACLFAGAVQAHDLDAAIPAPAFDPSDAAPIETAVLAGGCFWGQQAVFEHVKGVLKVVAGYSGGSKATAFYPLVGTETTGHAESVEITFDPKVVSFGRLLQIYFSVSHDPTELNFQGPDTGTSYRSEIFFASPDQQKIAAAYVAQLGAGHFFAAPIVTKIEPLKGFYDAEGYHQDFLVHNPGYPYIVINDLPKIAALARVYPQYYRTQPVLLASVK